MAPLDPNNTARFFWDYTVDGANHTFITRHNGILSPGAAGASVATLLTTIASQINLITINTCRSAAQGSDFSFPVTSGIEGSQYGAGVGNADTVPRELNFVGRSSGGRRCRLGIFGYKGNISTWRVTGAEVAAVQNAVNHLNASVGIYLAIDGVEPVWYPYVNVLYNAYWQGAVRA